MQINLSKKYEQKLLIIIKRENKLYNLETYGSIKLCDFNKENLNKTKEDINCYKTAIILMNKMINFVTNNNNDNFFKRLNDHDNSNSDISANYDNDLFYKYNNNSNNKLCV